MYSLLSDLFLRFYVKDDAKVTQIVTYYIIFYPSVLHVYVQRIMFMDKENQFSLVTFNI